MLDRYESSAAPQDTSQPDQRGGGEDEHPERKTTKETTKETKKPEKEDGEDEFCNTATGPEFVGTMTDALYYCYSISIYTEVRSYSAHVYGRRSN